MRVDHYQELMDRGWRRSTPKRAQDESATDTRQIRHNVLQARSVTLMLSALHNKVSSMVKTQEHIDQN